MGKVQLPFYFSAFLAPTLVASIGFDGPRPTKQAPPEIDNWSPAPTKAPRIYDSLLELFKRAANDNTCGYINGSYSRSLTCNNNDYVCVTNTKNSAHGCCDPNSISACIIPTACIPSASLSTCTDGCLTNQYIAKCTNSLQPYCYNWLYVYANPSTTLTEYGCYTSPLTLTVLRTATSTPSSIASSSSSQSSTPSSTSSSSTSSTSSASSTTSSQSNTATATGQSGGNHTGAIAGGVVGGLAVLGAAAAGAVFLILRSRKRKNQQNTQNPHNPPTPMVQPEYKPVPGGPAGPHDPRYSQQYGQQQYQPYGQPAYMQSGAPQPGNQQPYYLPPGQEGKHGYAAGAQQGPYSPPHSPAPQYSQMQPLGGQAQPDIAHQLDSTPVPGHPGQGQHIYEAPTGRE